MEEIGDQDTKWWCEGTGYGPCSVCAVNALSAAEKFVEHYDMEESPVRSWAERENNVYVTVVNPKTGDSVDVEVKCSTGMTYTYIAE